MALLLKDIYVGRDARSVYTEKVENGYNVNKLSSNQFFSEIFEFKKNTDRIVIGTNRKNEISFYFLDYLVSKGHVEHTYINYLKFFLNNGYKPVKDNSVKNFDGPDISLLNAVYSNDGEIILLVNAKSKEEGKVNWLTVSISSVLMGYRPYGQPRKYNFNSNTKNDSDFDVLLSGLVSAFGVASMF